MSTRERWIVYPLLFLAIGLGLRSGIYLSSIEQQNRLDIGTLQCNTIQVVDPEGRPRIFIRTDPRDRSGVLEMISVDGQVVTSLRANEVGSALRLGSQRRRSELTVSNSGNQPNVAYQRSIANRLIFGEALFLTPEAHRELVRALSHLMQFQERKTPSADEAKEADDKQESSEPSEAPAAAETPDASTTQPTMPAAPAGPERRDVPSEPDAAETPPATD